MELKLTWFLVSVEGATIDFYIFVSSINISTETLLLLAQRPAVAM